MRWYEYKMETDDLCAPEDLKAKLLAMTDQLTEEEKNQPMMKTPAPARPAPVHRKKPVRFPVKRVHWRPVWRCARWATVPLPPA